MRGGEKKWVEIESIWVCFWPSDVYFRALVALKRVFFGFLWCFRPGREFLQKVLLLFLGRQE